MDERIDAYLDDLEAMHAWRSRHARHGEFNDEFVAQSAERTLIERLRGALGHTVRMTVDGREVAGTAVFLGAGICVLAAAEVTIVSLAGVIEMRVSTRRHRQGRTVLEGLGMSAALRRLAAAHEEIVVHLRGTDGTVRGHSELVAADYLEIAGRVIPLTRIAAIQARVNPFA